MGRAGVLANVVKAFLHKAIRDYLELLWQDPHFGKLEPNPAADAAAGSD